MGKLNVKAFGFACGLTWGLGMFLLGIIDMLTYWGDAWGALMSTVYIGYEPTIVGSLIGGAWGFVDAGIAGLAIAWFYNKFSKK